MLSWLAALAAGVGHASTVRPDPSTLGVVGERGSRHESCLQLGSGRCLGDSCESQSTYVVNGLSGSVSGIGLSPYPLRSPVHNLWNSRMTMPYTLRVAQLRGQMRFEPLAGFGPATSTIRRVRSIR